MAMSTGKQIGLAASLAAVAIGGALLADFKIRNKARSEQRQVVAKKTAPEKTDLERMVKDSQVWTFNEKENSCELYDHRLPKPTKFYFINNETEQKADLNVYTRFQNHFMLPMLNYLEAAIGNRGFTGSELLQVMSFYVDKVTRGADLYKITAVEVEEAITKLAKEGPAGFQLRLEKVLEKTPMIANAPKKKEPIEAVKEQERKAYEGFKAGQKYAEGFKRGYQEYTREQLDDYANWRNSVMRAELNSRLWRDCPRYYPRR